MEIVATFWLLTSLYMALHLLCDPRISGLESTEIREYFNLKKKKMIIKILNRPF
jgi:hypothetical protein